MTKSSRGSGQGPARRGARSFTPTPLANGMGLGGPGTLGAAEADAFAQRHVRLERLVLEELASLLRDEIADATLEHAIFTRVVLAADGKSARVHYTCTTPGAPVDDEAPSAEARAERERVAKALTRAAPFFRARLVDAVDMKQAPELRFVFDGVAATGDAAAGP